MLNKKQRVLYDKFYDSTVKCEHLDTKTEIFVGLAAAMALNCLPCQRYYLLRAKQHDVTKKELSEVLAKVMAVSAGQKRLQADEVLNTSNISLDDFK